MIRRPRQHSEKHLDFIRSLPCAICGNPAETEAAHIRFSVEDLGKRAVGMGEKPDDIWTIPLCGEHHRMQHNIGERNFWRQFNRDPIRMALALWAYTGQHDVGQTIVLAS